MKKVIGVIPARLGSSRLPQKVLADIQGKPMIQHVYQRVKQAKLLHSVLVACDDERILTAVERFHGQAVLTSVDHPCGSNRIAEAIKSLDVDIVVNIQGDEPMIDPDTIDELIKVMLQNSNEIMATLIKPITDTLAIQDPNVVKVVVDDQGYALYFSRCPIPFNRDPQTTSPRYFKHIGIYAYQKDFLLKMVQWPISFLENQEKLEQLRVLQNGFKIKTLITKTDSISVDTPEDLDRVKELMKAA